jgi:MFS family permease
LSPTFRALAHPNYRRYASGGIVSNVGTWLQRIAQDWLVLVLSGNNGTALGITTGLQFLPILLLSPYAGSIADRFPKRRLLQLAQVMMATPALVLGLLAVTGVVQQWHVYVIALVFGVSTAFEAPVRQAFVSELVPPEDLQNAVSLNSASFNAGRIVGPALAGLLIAAFGSGVQATGAVILLNAASYGAVFLALQRMSGGELRGAPAGVDRKHAVRDGLRYLRSRPDLVLVLSVMFFVGTFGLNFQLTSALMATEVYGKGAGEYGILGSVLALGSITGALLAARRAAPRLRLVLVAAVVFSLMIVGLGLMPTYLSFVLVSPLIGLASMTTITSANTFVQLSVPTAFRGRVMALYLMVFMGGTPIGSPLLGAVAEAFGARWSLIAGGLGSVLGTLGSVLLYVRASRRRGITLSRSGGWLQQPVARPSSVDSPGEPPLPAPGDPGRAPAAARDRGGRVAEPWLSRRPGPTAGRTAGSPTGSTAYAVSSSTTDGSSARSPQVSDAVPVGRGGCASS